MARTSERRRILVTGGAGFIGSNLVQSLLKQGNNVIVLDNYWTSETSSLQSYLDHPLLKVIKADITDHIADDAHADQIYHLACPASPVQFEKHPLKILHTCYQGTRNVLEAARRWNAKVLLASTSEVYGQAERNPQDETYFGNVNSFGPRSCYDEGKRVAEALVYAYRQQYHLDARIARIFNSYGPGMHASDGRVVCSFIGAALEGQEMVINGDGTSTRCFQFVDDCVDGLVKLMNSDWQGGPINIGSEKETTIIELAHIVGEIVSVINGQTKSDIVYHKALPDDPVQRRPDCELARKVLDWHPQISLSDGLHETIKWHMNVRSWGERAEQASRTAEDRTRVELQSPDVD